MQNENIEAFWQSYLETLPPDSPVRDESYAAEYFGDTPQLASELGALVADGTKTATCSALWEWEAEGDLSLQHWRDAHWRFFERSLAGIGQEPMPEMPLVCERFRVVYQSLFRTESLVLRETLELEKDVNFVDLEFRN